MIDRLRQSALFQAVAVFLGASWVVLQVIDLLTERLGLPEWVFPTALVLLGVGLVVVLATAWVQSRPSTTAAEEAGELPTDWEVAPADAIASLRAGRLPHLTWGRAALGGVVSISLLIGIAGAYVLVSSGGPSLGPAEVGADETTTGIAILPFSVNNPELEPWEAGIVDLLTPGLDGVAGYRTISSRTVLSRWEDVADGGALSLEEALGVGGDTGARYAVTGTVVALGPTVRLTAEAYDLADGSKVAEGTAEGQADNVLALVDELGLDLVRDLLANVGGANAEATMPERLTTRSLVSARAFLEGEEHYRAGRFRPAIESYEEAIAADSTFALPAWRAYMALLYVGLGEQQNAMEEKLLAVLDDLPARDRTLARLRLQISGDSVRSVVPALAAVERYPDDAEAWYMLGEVRHHEPGIAGGGHEGALEAFDRAIELAPGFIPYYYHPAEYAIGAGDRDRTEVLMAVLEEAEVDDSEIQLIRGGMEVFLGPLDGAREKLRDDPTSVLPYLFSWPIGPGMIPRVWEILEEMPVEGDVRATDMASAWAMTAGRQQAAFDLMRTIPLGNGVRVTLGRHHQDVLGTLPGFDLAEEFDASYCGPKDIPVRTACHEKVAMHDVDMGRYDQVRRFIAEQDSIADQHDVPRSAVIHRRYARSLAGYLAWKEGDIDRALREYGEARRLDNFAVTARWYLAEVFLDAGRALEAVDLFLSIDDSPTWSPFSRLRAAEVLEGLGDSERAATHYRAALSAWSSADEGFEPRARAEAGLARVGG